MEDVSMLIYNTLKGESFYEDQSYKKLLKYENYLTARSKEF